MVVTRRRLLHLTAIGTATLAGCTDGGSGEGYVVNTAEVSMVNSQFNPRNITVDAGTTVTWTNDDSTAHTVTSASDNWDTDTNVPGGEQTTHTFDQDGVYDVYCTYHGSADLSGMSMKVGVGDATIQDPVGGDGGGGGGY